MVLGMSLHAYTVLHALISFVAIASGVVVMRGLLTNRRMDGLTAFFLSTTALTSITGLLFPFHGVTPAIKLSIISLIVLAIAIVALSAAPGVEKNLCDRGGCVVVLQFLRAGGAVV